MSERIEIQPTRFWPWVLTLFWAGEAMLGIALGGFGLTLTGREDWFIVATMVGGALLLVVFGIMMGAASWSVVTTRGPIIVMDASGFLDRRLSDQVIPWRAMRWGVFATGKGGRSLQFHADVPGGLRVRWPMRMMGRLNAALRYPPHTVMSLGTGKSVQELAGLMARFRRPSF